MKVNNNRDTVDLSHASRAKSAQKAGAAKAKEKAGDAGEAAGASGPGAAASVELSSEAKSLKAANQAARSSDTDEAKIARVKAMIGSGTYKPDYGKVAEKMVNEDLLQELS